MNQTTHWPLGSRVPSESDHLAYSLTGTLKAIPTTNGFDAAGAPLRTYDRLSGELRAKPTSDRTQPSGPVGWLDAGTLK